MKQLSKPIVKPAISYVLQRYERIVFVRADGFRSWDVLWIRVLEIHGFENSINET
jgi:hypothetical protein